MNTVTSAGAETADRALIHQHAGIQQAQTAGRSVRDTRLPLTQLSSLSSLGRSRTIRNLVLIEVTSLLLNIAHDLIDTIRKRITSPAGSSKPAESGGINAAPVAGQPAENTGQVSGEAPGQETDPAISEITGADSLVARESAAGFLNSHLDPNSRGEFQEEQLQHGVVAYLLSQRSGALLNEYQSAMKSYRAGAGGRASYEDGVKVALSHLVAANQITKADAERFAGIGFRAAQLDSNLNALYDDIASGDDKTSAVMISQRAAAKVEQTLNDILAGRIPAPSRSLNATSTGATSTGANSTDTNSAGGTSGSTKGWSAASIDLRGFLWKPNSSSDNKLAILFPASIASRIRTVSLYRSLPAGPSSLLEQGQANGKDEQGRAVFRFKKQGRSYPDGLYVVAELTNAERVQVRVLDASRRLEK